jgi:hypothetical protein
LGASEDVEEDVDDPLPDPPLDPPPYPSEYHPPPFRRNAEREMSFSSLPEHSVHWVSGASFIFWMTSIVRPHDVHRYS